MAGRGFNVLASFQGGKGTKADPLMVDLSPAVIAAELGPALAAQATAMLLEHRTPGGDPLPPDKTGAPRGVRSGRYARSWHAVPTARGCMVLPDGEPGQDDRVYGEAELMTERGLDTPELRAALQRAADKLIQK